MAARWWKITSSALHSSLPLSLRVFKVSIIVTLPKLTPKWPVCYKSFTIQCTHLLLFHAGIHCESKVNDVKTSTNLSRSCCEVQQRGFTKSDTYRIDIDGEETLVYCDLNTDGGGWTVFQRSSSSSSSCRTTMYNKCITRICRRVNGDVNFNNNWEEYVDGFGEVCGSYWLGLEKMHKLTNGQGKHVIRVDLVGCGNADAYAKYDDFLVCTWIWMERCSFGCVRSSWAWT